MSYEQRPEPAVASANPARNGGVHSPREAGSRPAKAKPAGYTDDEVREIILRYLYKRNQNATSRRGKITGAAVTIRVLRADLKASHGINVHQVHANLTYLESQGWVEDQPIQKTFRTPTGNVLPSTTHFYIITAAGIDRLKGPSMFTRDRFQGIKIEATGQNVITLGDGNQVNARFEELGKALAELRQGIKNSDKISEADKLDLVVDVDSIQTQLAKLTPNQGLVTQLWEGISRAADVAGLVDAAAKVGHLLKGLF